MHFLRVESQDSVSNVDGYYAWGLFASGFEKRSIYAPSLANPRAFRRQVALGFSEARTLLSRQDNDNHFEKQLGIPVIVPNDHETFILSELDKLLGAGDKRKVSLLVDYSVMTRAWYGLILNWARFADHDQPIEIDFVYSFGKYLSEFDPLSISEIVTLPGYEGISAGLRRTVAVFGLGFDKYATLAVYDRLEPDSLFCCVAGDSKGDVKAAKAIHENEVLCEAAERVIVLPLGDVASAFTLLSDHILSRDDNSHIVVVPMGPKPHVLVSLLLALRMSQITCLHARGIRAHPVQVEAEGPVSIARVTFIPE